MCKNEEKEAGMNAPCEINNAGDVEKLAAILDEYEKRHGKETITVHMAAIGSWLIVLFGGAALIGGHGPALIIPAVGLSVVCLLVFYLFGGEYLIANRETLRRLIHYAMEDGEVGDALKTQLLAGKRLTLRDARRLTRLWLDNIERDAAAVEKQREREALTAFLDKETRQ
ncbi:hypothetical protein JXH75_004862 [Salmonella enterica subsp. enterica serovar Oranienburg]|nr:hypothetical protein [Salmonella enterica subsp. enterica serovar Oranienburg]